MGILIENNQSHQESCNVKGGEKIGRSGNSGYVEEGGQFLTKKSEVQFLSTLFLVGKRMGKPYGHQPERVEEISSICLFQNRLSLLFERNATARRCSVQDRLKM